MKALWSLAILGSLLALAACKSEEQEYREHYEREAPAVKPYFAILDKIGATPAIAKACAGPPAAPLWVLRSIKPPTLNLPGNEIPSFDAGTGHPCFGMVSPSAASTWPPPRSPPKKSAKTRQPGSSRT